MRRLFTLVLALLLTLVSQENGNASQGNGHNIFRLLAPAFFAKFVPAVSLNGTTLLMLNRSLFGIPDTSKTLFANIWFKTSSNPSVQSNLLIADSDDAVTGSYIAAITFNQLSDGLHFYFWAGCSDPDGMSWYEAWSQEKVPLNDDWHVITTDVYSDGSTSTPTVRMKLDKQPLSMSVFPGRPGRQGCVFEWNKVTKWVVAGDTQSPQLNYTGDMAELYADMTGRLSVNSVDSFATTFAGQVRALGLGQDCILPLGDIPNLCLRGGPSHFPLGPASMQNFPAYLFELNNGGTLRTAKSAPCNVRAFTDGCAPSR